MYGQNLGLISGVAFILIIVFSGLIGFLLGWKKALYWGIGILAILGIGVGLWALCGDAFTKSMKGLLNVFLSSQMETLPEQQFFVVCYEVSSIFFYLIIFLSGLSLLSIIYLFVKRFLKRNKESSVGLRYLGRISGALITSICIVPLSSAITQISYTFSSSESELSKSGSFTTNIYNITSTISSFDPTYYLVDNEATPFEYAVSLKNMTQIISNPPEQLQNFQDLIKAMPSTIDDLELVISNLGTIDIKDGDDEVRNKMIWPFLDGEMYPVIDERLFDEENKDLLLELRVAVKNVITLTQSVKDVFDSVFKITSLSNLALELISEIIFSDDSQYNGLTVETQEQYDDLLYTLLLLTSPYVILFNAKSDTDPNDGEYSDRIENTGFDPDHEGNSYFLVPEYSKVQITLDTFNGNEAIDFVKPFINFIDTDEKNWNDDEKNALYVLIKDLIFTPR